jgi:hypothetical protein
MNIAVLEPYSDRDEFEEFKWDIKKYLLEDNT